MATASKYTRVQSVSMRQSQSKYISHLRKAFLLRVHPDRFRLHSEEVRKKQADIVQAIGSRMELADFTAYTHTSSR